MNTAPETLAALALLALAPFVLTMVTSFAKLMVVLGLLRQAIGAQQTPPNTVLAGIALILSLHVMAPVIGEISTELRPLLALSEAERSAQTPKLVAAVTKPLGSFLRRNASEENRTTFLAIAAENGAPEALGQYREAYEVLTIDAPAFLITELSEAFLVGFMLFLPFLVIDLVVTNILLALGAQTLTPTALTLPLKIMLFLLADGWRVVLHGLARAYS